MTSAHGCSLPRRWDPRLLAGSLEALALGLAACCDDSGDNWGAIEPSIAERARVCSYSTESTVVVEDTGHSIQLDQPELVVDQLLALLPSSS